MYEAPDDAAFSDKMSSYMSERLFQREALTPGVSKEKTIDSQVNIMIQNEEELSFNNGFHKAAEREIEKDQIKAETPTQSIESLLTLNQILTDVNNQLENENSELKERVECL